MKKYYDLNEILEAANTYRAIKQPTEKKNLKNLENYKRYYIVLMDDEGDCHEFPFSRNQHIGKTFEEAIKYYERKYTMSYFMIITREVL